MEISRSSSNTNNNNNNNQNNKKMTRPSKDQAPLNCPRCNSLNTKFCYYNNYSLSQPRYFCKTCRRYWTQGGSLRNVPVGGGSRKNKRPPSSISSSAQPAIPPPPAPSLSKDYMKLFPPVGFPNPSHRLGLDEAHDLNLSYPPIPSSAPTVGTNANVVSKGLSLMMMGHNFMQDLAFSSGEFPSSLLDFKPATTAAAAASSSLLNFSLAHNGNNSNDGRFGVGGGPRSFQLGLQEEISGGREARVLFPVEDLKQSMPSNGRAATDHQQQQYEQNNGSSSGLLQGGGGGGGAADSSNAGFWNHGLLLSGSTPWIHGNQIQ
ncbi:hypothetical protein CDL15_Pgr021697 [Punica granatum]|nr:hypothetical protein CDL15_Pgr021697 [Punica granatum]